MENLFKGHDIEMMFSRIIGKLEIIEEKLNENNYPAEKTLKLDFVERVKAAERDVSKGKCLNFDNMDDFLKSIEK